jgi:hypothetical protein
MGATTAQQTLVDGVEHHYAIQHCDTEQGDKADGAEHRQVLARDIQRGNAVDQRQR